MNVLIVEDDQILSLMLKQMVREMDLTVLDVVTKGADAVEKVLTSPCNLILMDIMLEDDMDGIEAYRRIRKNKNIPVIYITGNSDIQNIKRASEIGFHEFLSKPVVFEDLQSAIKELY